MPDDTSSSKNAEGSDKNGTEAPVDSTSAPFPDVLPAATIPPDIVCRDRKGQLVANSSAYPELRKVVGVLDVENENDAAKEMYAALLMSRMSECREVLVGNEAYKFQHKRAGGLKERNIDVIGRVTETSIVAGEAKGDDLYKAIFLQLASVVEQLRGRGIRTEESLVVGVPIERFMYAQDIKSADSEWIPSGAVVKKPIPNFNEHKNRNPRLNLNFVYLLDRSLTSNNPYIPTGLAIPRDGFLPPKTDLAPLPLYSHVRVGDYWGPVKKFSFPDTRGALVKLSTAKVGNRR
jgi:hypothetical protein